MTDTGPLPADDPTRQLVVADPNDSRLRRVAVVGDVYTILVTGEETAGRYCLIDMVVPPGGGPPPHRHDLEEMFTLLEGELEFTFRGETATVRAGSTVNVPANAPHTFRNVSGKTAHMLCLCSPAGMDQFFLEVGDPLPNRDSPPPTLNEAELRERVARIMAAAPKYRVEVLAP